MSLLGSIFDNPGIKAAAFSQLKKLVKSENLEMIIVRLDPATDELEFDLYKPGEASVIKTAIEQTQLLTENTTENANDQIS